MRFATGSHDATPLLSDLGRSKREYQGHSGKENGRGGKFCRPARCGNSSHPDQKLMQRLAGKLPLKLASKLAGSLERAE